MLSDNGLFFQDDTSGDYRNAIMALVIGGPPPQMAAKCEYHVLGRRSLALGQTCLSALCFTLTLPLPLGWNVTSERVRPV